MKIRTYLLGLVAAALAACGGGSGDSNQGTNQGTLAGHIALAGSSLQVPQATGTISMVVSRTGGASGAASVAYATSNGTAIAGTDYTTKSGTLNWADGESGAKNVDVPISTTLGFDGSKSFTFTLSNATGADLGTTVAATIAITGSGAPGATGTVAVALATYSAAQSDASIAIAVTRTGGSSGAASVAYATANGSATAGTQYTSTSGTLNWTAGDAAVKTVTVPLSNATPFSGTKTFTLTLSGVTGATLGAPATTTVTINGSASGGGSASSVQVDKHILVDQFGYRPNDAKVAVIRNPQTGYDSADKITPGTSYQLRKASDGTVVLTGAPTVWNAGATEASSGDQGWWFDFSSVTTAGSYFVYDVTRDRRSPTFTIGQSVYKPILKAALKMFFYQRSGFAKTAQFATNWADGISYTGTNQDLQARDATDQSNDAKRRDVSGGWFDAGDMNKYVTFAATPVNQLLTAYQNNPAVFTDDFGIPESGDGIPDVINEVKWEVDWLKKMQFGDGSVGLKVGVINFTGASPPSSDTAARYYLPACTSSTIAAAAMFAHAAVVYGGITALASEKNDLQTRAINAWNNYVATSPKQTNCDTGLVQSGDADWSESDQNAQAVVAAVYLFALTGDATYGNYVKANYTSTKPFNDIGWSRYSPEQGEALLFYTTLAGADTTTKNAIRSAKQNDVTNNTNIYGFTSADLYRDYLDDPQYHWGSNQVRANYGNTNVDAVKFQLTNGNDASINTRAVEVLHYFHGVNPFGTVYLTNMSSYGATFSLNAIFHSWYFVTSAKWGDVRTRLYGPPPGYVPGGPNASTSVSLAPPGGQPRQKAYRDWNGDAMSGDPQASWEITEPGIYYQAAYVKLVSAFAQ